MESLFDSAVLINLRLACFGTTKKLNAAQYEVDACKEKTKATKQICQSDELKAIKGFQADLRKWVKDRSIPGYAGLDAVRLQAVPKIEDHIREALPVFDNLVEQFMAIYQDLQYRDELSKEAGGLGALYDASDYPLPDKVRASFSITHDYKELGAPGKLKTISAELYEQAEQACKEQFKNAVVEGQALIRGEFAKLIFHVNERLTGDVGGKKKIFRDSLISNVSEWVEAFSLRDYGDEELGKLVNELASSMQGITAESLRDNATIRAAVAAKTESIKAAMDTMLINKPGRAISLEADDTWGAL